jgi:opacity protein-like surface antigen
MRVALFVCLGLCLISAPAAAELNNGLYLELQGGGSFFQDADIEVTGIPVPFDAKAEFDNGWTAGAAIGFRIFEMLRLEGHGSWRMADFDQVSGAGASLDADDAFAGAAIFLGNAYLDIPLPLPIRPYVGAGAGVGIFSADVDGDDVDVDSDDTTFAWNVMGGAFVPILRHLELDVRYRYITADDPKVSGELFGLDGQIDAEFEAHEVVGALRVVF